MIAVAGSIWPRRYQGFREPSTILRRRGTARRRARRRRRRDAGKTVGTQDDRRAGRRVLRARRATGGLGGDRLGLRWRRELQRPGGRGALLRQLEPPQHDQGVRRGPDRRQRRFPARADRCGGRQLPADHDLPRLRRGQARAQRDAALPRARLRHLLDDQSRLPGVVRLGRLEDRRPLRLRARLRAPDRQSLRGPRRAGVRRRAGRPGPHRRATDRGHRRLLRRRHVDGARRTAGPKGARRRLPRPMDQPGRQADDDRRRGREHPVDRPRLLADAEREHAGLRRRRPVRRGGSA